MTTKEYRKLDQLKLNEDNPRGIKKHDFERLKKQVQKLGMYKPILITSEGKVLGGNMRVRVYQDLGIEDVWVSVVNPKDETEEMEYILSDNDRAGYWEEQDLAELITSIPELELETYAIDLGEPKDLTEFMKEFAPEVVEDDVPEVSDEESISKLGEVYQLGRHRLMCGDSTNIEDVEKLMNGQKADMVFTDPPYGLGGYGGRNNMELKGDDVDVKPFYACIPYEVGEVYVWGNWKNLREDLPYAPRDVIIWRKNNFGLGAGYRGQYEMCFYFGNFNGSDSDIWDVSKDTNYEHPTQKPVELSARAIKNSSKSDNIVLDLFGGSGSTLIACEQLNRTCYMMELDPKYCDVIRKRYAKFTGKEDEWEKNSPRI